VVRRFLFDDDPRFRLLLRMFGVEAGHASVDVDGHQVEIRFGPWQLSTGRSNIAEATVTGPYRWWRAIGVRMSLADRGLTFGTSTRGGVCLQLYQRQVLRFRDRPTRFRPPSITVTVTDRAALVADLTGPRDRPQV
jgi:hypothetical protein